MNDWNHTYILEVKQCQQAYKKDNNHDGELVVLKNVNLNIKPKEIVALLGRSGSGKSTLLRIVSGLLKPSYGEVLWKGEKINGPTEGIAMVFQSFALFPWLTVKENVELGLEAKGVARLERSLLAEKAIDLIGLGGYDGAYPKELSGGMRQRVGLARALVVSPDLLLMDEPFSALDVLTAETLRTDLIELWAEDKLPIQSILMVTHNIEEAVLMCDRIIIFSSNPGTVAHMLEVPFAHPRNRQDPDFREMVEQIYAIMTSRSVGKHNKPEKILSPEQDDYYLYLQNVNPSLFTGMMEKLADAPYNGRADLPALADTLQLEADKLLPLGEALQLFCFADMSGGDLVLTEAGRYFVEAELEDRKKLFAETLIAYVPLVARIRQILNERWNHRTSAVRFKEELENYMSPEYAEETIRTAISWGRYAELFVYDEEAEQFSLEEEERE